MKQLFSKGSNHHQYNTTNLLHGQVLNTSSSLHPLTQLPLRHSNNLTQTVRNIMDHSLYFYI